MVEIMVSVTAVEKIGGSSLLDDGAYSRYADFLARKVRDGEKLVVVISAKKGDTDRLLDEAKRLFPEGDCSIEDRSPIPRHLLRQVGHILTGGEFKSAILLRDRLKDQNISVKVVLHEIELLAFGDDPFNCNLVGVNSDKLESIAGQNDIVIIPGYGAIHESLSQYNLDEDDLPYVLLGRGATDYIAVAIGAVLKCPVRFRKGSGKIFAVDPNILTNAKSLHHLTYGQARSFVEYSREGQQFLAMKCLDLATHYHVPIHFLPGCEHDFEGSGTSIGVSHCMPEDRQFIMKPFRALAVQDVFLFIADYYNSDLEDIPKSISLCEAFQQSGIPYGDLVETVGIGSGEESSFITVQRGDINNPRIAFFFNSGWARKFTRATSLTIVDSSITPDSAHILRAKKSLRYMRVILSSSLGNTIRFIVELPDKERAISALAEEFGLTS
jgi:aspartokinase